jgi:hypothetical protein
LHFKIPFPSPLPPGGGRGGGEGVLEGRGGGNILYSKYFTYYEQHPINNILKLLGDLELTANLLSTQLLRTILRLFPGFLLPRGEDSWETYASVASVPTYARVGAGGGAGWVLPWFPLLLTRGRGRGSGDNPFTRHFTYTSCAR